MTPVFGALVYGLLPAAVRGPQGNPLGKGLLVRNEAKVGTWSVPHCDALRGSASVLLLRCGL
jgi:hypothetical protein